MTVAVFAFLSRYLCQTTALLLAKSDRELYILGAMPFVYYVFDYSTTKFSMLLYSGNKVVVEFLAFAMCISYVIFLFVYFQEYELKNRAEQYEQVRSSEHRMKILRHDMRHHLAAIQTFISQQEPERALDYIQEINKQYDDTVIHSFCRNELLNSVLSIYQTRFAENQIVFDVQIQTSRLQRHLFFQTVSRLQRQRITVSVSKASFIMSRRNMDSTSFTWKVRTL